MYRRWHDANLLLNWTAACAKGRALGLLCHATFSWCYPRDWIPFRANRTYALAQLQLKSAWSAKRREGGEQLLLAHSCRFDSGKIRPLVKVKRPKYHRTVRECRILLSRCYRRRSAWRTH
jgi:hypothetical protein